MKRKLIEIALLGMLAFNFTACEDKKEFKDTLKIEKEKKVKLTKPQWDSRLSAVEDNAGIWFQEADDSEIAAYNIANTYSNKLKDYEKAIEWYLYSDSIKINSSNLYNLAYTYKDKKDYKKSVIYYKKAFEVGEIEAGNNLALLYRDTLKDYDKAIKWYKKVIERESSTALKGMATLYYKKKENIKASAYLINLITFPNFTKEEIIDRLKNHYKFDDETIKKGYELQLTMPGLPKRYTGGI